MACGARRAHSLRQPLKSGSTGTIETGESDASPLGWAKPPASPSDTSSASAKERSMASI